MNSHGLALERMFMDGAGVEIPGKSRVNMMTASI